MGRFDLATGKMPPSVTETILEPDNRPTADLGSIQKDFLSGILSVINYRHPHGERLREAMQPGEHRRSFRTLRISLPRAMGNTSLAIEVGFAIRDTIIVVSNSSQVRRVGDQIKNDPRCRMRYTDGIPAVYAANESRLPRTSRLLIIDVASTWPQTAVDDICLRHSSDFYLIIG